jgi:arabinose-5-phosphate isomerase
MNILFEVKKALEIEREALEYISQKIDDQVVKAVDLMFSCKGRIVVTGMGKTGLVGRKIAATLASTGTPSLFLHPAEAIHGDLGLVTRGDVVIAVSNSGETDELVRILPHIKRFQVKIISLTGNKKSTLAEHSDVVIDVSVEREADPLGIAPTASTTATMAMGDALAAALLKKRDFDKEQFAIFHPGGSLGKKLLWTVNDLMHTGNKIPIVKTDATVRQAICEISEKKLGATFILEEDQHLLGVFTDGDIRRLLEKNDNPLSRSIAEVMTHAPKTVKSDALAAEAVRLMEENAITILPVIDEDERIVGVIHLHDLVKAGLA